MTPNVGPRIEVTKSQPSATIKVAFTPRGRIGHLLMYGFTISKFFLALKIETLLTVYLLGLFIGRNEDEIDFVAFELKVLISNVINY